MASRLLLNQLMRLKQLLLLLRLVDDGCRRTARLATCSPLLLLLQRDVVRTDEGRVELVARDGRDAVRGGPGRRLGRTRPVNHRTGIRAAAVAAAADELLLGLLTERLPPVGDARRFAVLVLSHGDSAVRYQQDILRLLLVMVLLLLMVLLELLMVLLLLLLER